MYDTNGYVFNFQKASRYKRQRHTSYFFFSSLFSPGVPAAAPSAPFSFLGVSGS